MHEDDVSGSSHLVNIPTFILAALGIELLCGLVSDHLLLGCVSLRSCVPVGVSHCPCVVSGFVVIAHYIKHKVSN